MTLVASMRDFFSRHGLEKTYWIAYSGGLDSHVLLSLCHAVRQHIPVKLHAIYINHHLSLHADEWAAHCARVATDYDIDFSEKSLRMNLIAGDSLEEVARENRYQAMAECLGEDDVLLTAHHQDDQAETLLLQLLRGAGPKGLAAMPAVKLFARGLHARPLLGFQRTELLQYAEENKLQWIEDESNLNRQLTRNFIRHEVMPLLKQRWHSVTNTLARSAANCAEAQYLLEKFAREGGEQVRGSLENTLSVTKLLKLDVARQKLFLRLWIQQQGHPIPDTKKIATIQSAVLSAAWDARPCVAWQNTQLRRHKDDLFIMPTLQQQSVQNEYHWDMSAPLSLPAIGKLTAISVQGKGMRSDLQSVSVRFRQGGEVIDMFHRGRHTLKNLFQEWNVLPWERDRLPLIFVNEKLVSVVGYYVDKSVVVQAHEVGYELALQQ